MMEFVNGKDDIPYMKWKIKAMFETTNQKISSIWKTTIFSDLTRHTVMTPHCQKLHLVAAEHFWTLGHGRKVPRHHSFRTFGRELRTTPQIKQEILKNGPSLTINLTTVEIKNLQSTQDLLWHCHFLFVKPFMFVISPCLIHDL